MPAAPVIANTPPRLLLLTSQYFLLGEIEAACRRLDIPHRLLDLAAREMDLDAFVRLVGGVMDEFRPDAVLTVNHLGVDLEGVLTGMLERSGVPLVSWFVDNPMLTLPAYHAAQYDRTLLLTWDADTVAPLRAMGYGDVHYLPLATDPHRFTPEGITPRADWTADVSFVGNSMLHKVHKRLQAARPDPALFERLMDLARGFGDTDEPSVRAFMAAEHPGLLPLFEAMDTTRRLAFEALVTWQSTLLYRLDCVLRTLPFHPLIVGDDGWDELLGHMQGMDGARRRLPELAYYDQLPGFYPQSAVNFNATSRQMKGAVNQRVFDVPAAGAFLLTDHRRQIEDLFEPGEELALYHHPDEIAPRLERWLADPEGRARISSAARRRVLAEHTYDHRLAALIRLLGETF